MTILTQSYGMLKRETNPQFARKTLLDTYERLAGNIAATAYAMQCNRHTVYLALEKQARDELNDASHAPRVARNRSPDELEQLVLRYRKKMGFGKRRLHNHILTQERQYIPESTIGAILRRHKVTKVIGKKTKRNNSNTKC